MAKKETGRVKAVAKKGAPKKVVTAGTLLYEHWQIHPHVLDAGAIKPLVNTSWKRMVTKHEGDVLYYKLWNFWVRAGSRAMPNASEFFRDYETVNSDTDALLKDIGFPWKKAESEEDFWKRIGMVWSWLRNNVQDNGAEYTSISSIPGTWPSIVDYARYYKNNNHLVWAACFSKAHLFATLLGRMAYPRYRFAMAEAHHTENGAPPTATHVYVAVYVGERWYYLDPTAISTVFPDYAHRRSIGVDSFASVDYEHPYEIIPVPLSGFEAVPYLPG